MNEIVCLWGTSSLSTRHAVQVLTRRPCSLSTNFRVTTKTTLHEKKLQYISLVQQSLDVSWTIILCLPITPKLRRASSPPFGVRSMAGRCIYWLMACLMINASRTLLPCGPNLRHTTTIALHLTTQTRYFNICCLLNIWLDPDASATKLHSDFRDCVQRLRKNNARKQYGCTRRLNARGYPGQWLQKSPGFHCAQAR